MSVHWPAPSTGDSHPEPRQGTTNKKNAPLDEKVTETRKRRHERRDEGVPCSSPPSTAKTIRPKLKDSPTITQTDAVGARVLRKRTQGGEIKAETQTQEAKGSKEIEGSKIRGGQRKKSAIAVQMNPDTIQQAQRRVPAITNCLRVCEDFTKDLDASGQDALVLAIASKLQDVLDDPTLHGTDVYFKKGTSVSIYTENGPQQVTLAWTFYINIAPDQTFARIELNIPESPLGTGTYKRVSEGHIVQLALSPTRTSTSVGQARLRPADPKDTSAIEMAIASNAYQEQVKIRMQQLGFPVHMTEPARVRLHTGPDGEKIEMTMPIYKGDFEKIGGYSLEQRVARLYEVYATINYFNIAGVVHRDLKSGNVLLDHEHAYVHDFDLAQIEQVIAMNAEYVYWDRGGQLGLVTHASDVIGAVLTSCEVIFHESMKAKKLENCDREFLNKGVEHAFQTLALPSLKGDYEKIWLRLPTPITSEQFVAHLQALLASNETPGEKKLEYQKLLSETLYKMELLKICCDVVSREDAYVPALVGSCVCYFAGKSAREYETLLQTDPSRLQQDYNHGAYLWVQKELGRDLLNTIRHEKKVEINNLKDFLNLPDVEFEKEYPFLTKDERKKLERILEAADSLSSLIEKAKEQKLLPQTGDASIFTHLMSDNPEHRAYGRHMCFQLFPTAKLLSDSIGDIPRRLSQ